MAGQISSGKLTVKAATQSFLETIGKNLDYWLEAPLDRRGFRVHNVVIVGSAQ